MRFSAPVFSFLWIPIRTAQTTVEATLYYVVFYSHRRIGPGINHEYVQQHFSCFCLYSWFFLDKTRTQDGPCYSRARSLSTPNRIHAEQKLFVEHVRERMKGYRWQLPPQNYSRIQYPPLLHLNIRFLYFFYRRTRMFLLLGFFPPVEEGRSKKTN